MAQVTFDAPFTLNPAQARRLKLRHTHIDHDANTLVYVVDFLDQQGNVMETRKFPRAGAAAQTWVESQEPAAYTFILNRLGATGTVG